MPHEPKKKHSKATKRIRRASINLTAMSLIVCANCSQKTLAHMACRNCGFYAGKLAKIVKQKAIITKT